MALVFEGARDFRNRIVLSTLSGKPIRIEKIRALDDSPGLRDYEANLLRLFELLTNGCRVEINETGTILKYTPGTIVNGRDLVHDCGRSRSIGWFLQALAPIAALGKKQLGITLRGITNDVRDPGVDAFRTVTVPLLKEFGIEENLSIKILKRGCPPEGGGEVLFTCPNVRQLRPVMLVDPGMVKRVRGVAYSCRVSPQMSNRTVASARALLNSFLPDVYIFTDHFKGAEAGVSPGYGITLVAESTTGARVSVEATAGAGPGLPEDIGEAASKLLCEEIANGGVVDSAHQSLCLMLMALGPEDVAKVRLGRLAPHAISTLRHIRDFLGVTFKIAPDLQGSTLLLTCMGSGYTNLAKKIQ